MANDQRFDSRYTGEEMENAFSVALAIANHSGIPKGTGKGSVQIISMDTDRLTSDGERIPTSAAVARAIAASRKVSELLTFKGIVQATDDLPADAKPGYVYIVEAEGNENYAWDGANWTPIGKLIAPIVVCGKEPDASGNVALTADDVGAVPTVGGAMTGNLSVPAPTDDLHAANKAYVDTKTVTATLAAASWVGDSAPYTQTITVSGLTDGRLCRVYPVFGDDVETNLAMQEACACVSFAKRDGQNVTFTCLEDKPEIDIGVMVEVYV